MQPQPLPPSKLDEILSHGRSALRFLLQATALSVILFFGVYGGQHAHARRSATTKAQEAVVVPAKAVAKEIQAADKQVFVRSGGVIALAVVVVFLFWKSAQEKGSPSASSAYGSAAVQLSHNKAPDSTLVKGGDQTPADAAATAAAPAAPVAAVVSILDKAPVPPPSGKAPVPPSPAGKAQVAQGTPAGKAPAANAAPAKAAAAPSSPNISPAVALVKAQMRGPAMKQEVPTATKGPTIDELASVLWQPEWSAARAPPAELAAVYWQPERPAAKAPPPALPVPAVKQVDSPAVDKVKAQVAGAAVKQEAPAKKAPAAVAPAAKAPPAAAAAASAPSSPNISPAVALVKAQMRGPAMEQEWPANKVPSTDELAAVLWPTGQDAQAPPPARPVLAEQQDTSPAVKQVKATTAGPSPAAKQVKAATAGPATEQVGPANRAMTVDEMVAELWPIGPDAQAPPPARPGRADQHDASPAVGQIKATTASPSPAEKQVKATTAGPSTEVKQVKANTAGPATEQEAPANKPAAAAAAAAELWQQARRDAEAPPPAPPAPAAQHVSSPAVNQVPSSVKISSMKVEVQTVGPAKEREASAIEAPTTDALAAVLWPVRPAAKAPPPPPPAPAARQDTSPAVDQVKMTATRSAAAQAEASAAGATKQVDKPPAKPSSGASPVATAAAKPSSGASPDAQAAAAKDSMFDLFKTSPADLTSAAAGAPPKPSNNGGSTDASGAKAAVAKSSLYDLFKPSPAGAGEAPKPSIRAGSSNASSAASDASSIFALFKPRPANRTGAGAAVKPSDNAGGSNASSVSADLTSAGAKASASASSDNNGGKAPEITSTAQAKPVAGAALKDGEQENGRDKAGSGASVSPKPVEAQRSR